MYINVGESLVAGHDLPPKSQKKHRRSRTCATGDLCKPGEGLEGILVFLAVDNNHGDLMVI